MAKVIIVNAPGPQGQKGDKGDIGPPGTGTVDSSSFVSTSSFYAFTQSYYSDSASFANAISNVTFDTSSLVSTSSFYDFTQSYYNDSASFVVAISNVTFDTSSLVSTSSFNQFTSSYNTGSFSGSFIGTSSWAFNALTASLAPNYVLNSITSSMLEPYVLSSQTSSFTTTSSFNQFTQSYYSDSSSFDTKISNLTNATSSYVLNSQTGSFATTGSNVFKASQTITGSLTITNDLIVLGSSSITYISQSTLDISTNLITVNTNTPSVRFGGLAVIDSGSSPQTSGSILFDSQNNQWIFVHESTGGQITSSVFIQGPQTFNSLGNEITISTNRLTKGTGGDLGEHIGDSNITDTGTLVSINSNTEITGSLVVTNSITGSLFGTSSWAQNYNETDPIFTSKSGSFVTTSSFNSFTSSYTTGSFTGSFVGELTGTASYAITASFALSSPGGGISETLAIAYAIALG